MKKILLTGVLASLGLSTAMAASIANFTNATEQQNPYAQSNAQIQKQAVPLQEVNQGRLNSKEVNPLFKFTGEHTPSNVTVKQESIVRISH